MPCNWFDLCVIPEHDKCKGRGLIFWTKGVLANTANLSNKEEQKGHNNSIQQTNKEEEVL